VIFEEVLHLSSSSLLVGFLTPLTL
jgi:hypothetical protein